MRFLLTVIALLASASATPVQEAAGSREDVNTLDGIIAAYYEVVSRPAGVAADRDRDEWIHHPDALVAIAGAGPDGVPMMETMTLSEFHDRHGGAGEAGFYEWEVHREVHRFGSVAHVWSTYVSATEPDGEITGRGINSIQLAYDGERWWILSWVFDSERAGNRIPAEYLPDQPGRG